jgi:hypothetical protein
MTDRPRLLRGPAAARHLGLGRDTFNALVKAGHIRPWTNPTRLSPNPARYFSVAHLDEWAANAHKEAS